MDCVIFTLHRANNIGAFLQAYSMMTFVKAMGGGNTYFASFPSKSSSERKNLFSKVLRYIRAGDLKKLMYKSKNASMYHSVQSKFPILDMSTNPEFDIAIIGSDEVWNIKSNNFVHHLSYFGHGINAKRIIAYAPCGNGVNSDDFKELMPEEQFQKFTALSARDTDTINCVSEISGRDVAKVVDPTMLIDDFGVELPNCPISKGFILVYSYGISKRYVRDIKAFARKKRLPLISVGTYNGWCDKNIVATPWEFLSCLKAAKYVVVSTFHGTLLSVKFNKQFVCYAGNSSKVNDILTLYHLHDRNVKDSSDIYKLFDRDIDYQPVNEIIDITRKESIAYLKNAMGI